MAEGTLQILGLGTSAVPLDYNVSGNQPLDLIAVKADFDGTSAGSDFVPVVEILSDAGHVMAQSIGSTVTAGDSVTVTFAPFLRGQGAVTGGGIQFDTYPQSGGYLYVETTDAVLGSMQFVSAGVMQITTSGLEVTSNGYATFTASGDWQFQSDNFSIQAATDLTLGSVRDLTLAAQRYLNVGTLLPTSPVGLPAGTVWNDLGTLKVA